MKTHFIIFAYINKAEFIEYFNQHYKKFNCEAQDREVLGKIYDHYKHHSNMMLNIEPVYFDEIVNKFELQIPMIKTNKWNGIRVTKWNKRQLSLRQRISKIMLVMPLTAIFAIFIVISFYAGYIVSKI
jgi:hypothetical protein